VLDLSWVHNELTPYYSHTGRPSIDPVLMIRMLIVGYVSTRCAIASGRWPRRKPSSSHVGSARRSRCICAHEANPEARPDSVLRGLSGVKDDVLLTATAQNLRRLAKILCRAPDRCRSSLNGRSGQKDGRSSPPRPAFKAEAVGDHLGVGLDPEPTVVMCSVQDGRHSVVNGNEVVRRYGEDREPADAVLSVAGQIVM
jgi:hypothetical protein